MANSQWEVAVEEQREFSRLVGTVRRESGLSVKEFAACLGCEPATVKHIERYGVKPTYSLVAALLADALPDRAKDLWLLE